MKKPRDLVEYVIVHEMVHLLEPTHSERFVSILAGNYPTWREARAELNELPLAAEAWAALFGTDLRPAARPKVKLSELRRARQ